MMLRKKEEYEEPRDAAATPPSPTTQAAGQQLPETDNPSEESAAPQPVESLADVFNAALATARGNVSGFQPTLARLNALLEKLQHIGIHNVGLEIADYNRLRALEICAKSPEPGPVQNNAVFCLMDIGEASFIIRIEEKQVISLHPENMNKPVPATRYLDSEEFWFTAKGKDKEKTREEKFIRYDLADEQDSLSLLKAVAETAAVCTAHAELRRFDITPSKTTLLKKTKIKIPG